MINRNHTPIPERVWEAEKRRRQKTWLLKTEGEGYFEHLNKLRY